MQMTQALTRAVQTRSRHTATIFQGRARTWREIGDRVPRLAAGIRALGVQPGDRVAILALNSDNYLELFFAIAWVGAVSVPLNTRWAEKENAYALNDAQTDILFVDDAYLDQVPALAADAGLKHLIYMGQAAQVDGFVMYEDLIAQNAPMADACGSKDDLCGIYYTGGTTGMPKGVMLSHKNVVYGSINWIASLQFNEDTRYLHSAGFFHLAGSFPAFALTMAGGTHVCLPKFEAELAFQAIQTHKVNYVLFVPTMINLMLNHPAFEDYDLSSVKTCEYGASPIPESDLEEVMQKLPTWSFIQGYGMTETSALNLSTPWKYHFASEGYDSKLTATGRAAFGIDIKIVDPDKNEVPRGEVGEIAIRGPQVMLGYWRKPEQTAQALHDGWMISGDGAYMDEDGFVYIVDRVKDMIVSGGENVYSKEVENAVQSHPAIRECAVIAIPDAKWGEAVHAVVSFRAGHQATDAEIIAHCKGLIANYKCPRSIEVRDALPVSAAGKLLKAELREPYWADSGRSVN